MKKELAQLMNKQVNYELYSAHIYLNMSCYCSAQNLDGFAVWFDKQYQEEIFHAKKFINYLVTKGYTPMISNWEENPATEYSSLLECAQISLVHEQEVSERINYMMSKAISEADYATVNFLNWFIEEQVEEEATFEKMIADIKLVKDAGLYVLDKDYGNRPSIDATL